MSELRLHDSHAHLELLLQRLGNLDSAREHTLGTKLTPLDTSTQELVDELLLRHDFFIQATVSTSNYDYVTQLFAYNSKIYFQLGSHPEIVKADFDLAIYLDEQQKYLNSIDKKLIIGIGEIGLDYYYTKEKTIIDKQKALMHSQIKLAVEMELPIVFHIRDAFDEAFEIIDQYPQIFGKFIVHCFTGTDQDLENILKRGGNIGVGGISTYKSAESLRNTLEHCPIGSILLETDLPFLAPTSSRGKDCIPVMIEKTADYIAQLKGVTTDQILSSSMHSCLEIFAALQVKFGINND
jgi:TatD DNase family protein